MDHHHHNHEFNWYSKAFGVGVALNLAYIALEVAFGLLVGSLALLADAGHNLSDVFSLLLAWGAAYLAARPPSGHRTYGFRRASILAALANAIILLIAIGGITWEAIRRLGHPVHVAGATLMWVAGVGALINSITAWMFVRGRKEDLNIKGAFLHMAADAGISLGVVGAGWAILLTGWSWVDPIVSLVIGVIIAVGTWGLLRDSANLALDAVPPGIHLPQVRDYLEHLPAVTAVHDLHVWGMSTTETALTAHLIRSESTVDDALLTRAAQDLREQFRIGHVTLQLETQHASRQCPQAEDKTV